MSEMQTVYVVIADRGEFDDRVTWVTGVFTDKAGAIALAEERLAAAQEASAWADEWDKKRRAAARITSGGYSPAENQQFVALHGPCPVAEADDFTVVAVPLNQWGEWTSLEPPA